MRAEDLQIGDLLRVNRVGLCIKKGTVVTVQGIDGSNNFPEKGLYGVADCRPLDESQFQGGIWLDYLDPIPLTPEILEKNGFESHKNQFGFKSYELGKDYLLENRGDRFCLVRRMPGHKYSTFWICNCYYIHQLQHAIRLLGVDKEINL